MEGHGVVPLRVSRLVKTAVVGLAAVPFVALGAPVVALGAPAYGGPTPQVEYWLRALHVTQAWRTGEGAGVVVAVLADGVDASQPDISGSVIAGPDFTGSGRRPGDRYYAVIGTGLASLIVGHGHAKNQGIVGVVASAKVLSVRVTLSPGDPLWSHRRITSRLPAAIAAGIRYAVNHGATIIDLPADPGMPDAARKVTVPSVAGPNPAEAAAVAYAVSKGVVLVAPAGDNAKFSDAANYPAAYPGVIAVGSFGRNFVLAPYSSRQPYVTLTATGQQIVAASPTGYQTMNSTSAASAIVAGIAAMVRSSFPALTAGQIRGAMIRGTALHHPGGQSRGTGYGTVDAQGAIRQAMAMSPPGAILAMKGALPRISPASPPTPSLGSAITSDLTKDGVISLVALIAMLALIAWYGSAGRQRDRQALLAVEQERRERMRPDHPTMLADPLLEYFGPQHARPTDQAPRPRSALTPRFQPTSYLTGRPALMQSGRAARLGLPAPASASDDWAAQASDPAASSRHADSGSVFTPFRKTTGGSGYQSARTASSAPSGGYDGSDYDEDRLPDSRFAQDRGFGRPVGQEPEPTVRQAFVSGSPPWAPAPEPTTALPWAPSTQRPGGFRPAAPRPDNLDAPGSLMPRTSLHGAGWSEPPARVSEPPHSLFDHGPVVPLSAPTPGPLDAPDADAGPQDSGGRPIYVWNPASATGDPEEGRDGTTDWLSIRQDSDLSAVLTGRILPCYPPAVPPLASRAPLGRQPALTPPAPVQR